jgi:RNA polymerase sigma-70 factor, ECF subfamily
MTDNDLEHRPGEEDRAFREGIVAFLPNLRAYSRFLIGAKDRADDLVSEAILRALAAQEQFTPGTNLRAWLFTILRNEFLAQMRRDRRDVVLAEVSYRGRQDRAGPSMQTAALELNELRRALHELSVEHREVLVLVGAAGLSYEEAAEISHCAVGTIKSRLNRARAELRVILEGEPERAAKTGS